MRVEYTQNKSIKMTDLEDGECGVIVESPYSRNVGIIVMKCFDVYCSIGHIENKIFETTYWRHSFDLSHRVEKVNVTCTVEKV